MELILNIIQYGLTALILLVGFSSLYLMFLAFLGVKFAYTSPINSKVVSPNHQLAILVPAYKNDEVLLDSTKHNLKILQNLQGIDFHYIPLCDRVQEGTLKALHEQGAHPFEISLDKSTKSRAINQWLDAEKQTLYTHVLVLDVDNLLHPDNLAHGLYNGLNDQHNWWQFKRIAANTNTQIAGLDAWSEIVNNNIFRRGAQKLGIPPALIGSGMLAPFNSFAEIHHKIDVTGGFDKWVEHYLMQQDIKVKYCDEVWIKDQKIADLGALKKQRTRWLAAQFLIAKQLLPTLLKSIFTLKLGRALKYYQLYLPPRILHLALAIVLPLITFWQKDIFLLSTLNLLALLIAFTVATPWGSHFKVLGLFAKNGIKLVWNYLGMFKGFKEANEKFIATQHQSNEKDSN